MPDSKMQNQVFSFNNLPSQLFPLAGQKAANLAKLSQKKYNIPDGFIILPETFIGDELRSDVWPDVLESINQLRSGFGSLTFAVRSSGLSEDTAFASFAGQFDTILRVETDAAIQEAIQTVRRSRNRTQVRSYGASHGIDTVHEMAVIVQRMVEADLSGVLFTANPINGDRNQIVLNYTSGTAEDLVSGRSMPEQIILEKAGRTSPANVSDLSKQMRPYLKKLSKLGKDLERELSFPQDIEWAIYNKSIYLLQSRPVTSLQPHNPITGEWNDSKTGNYLWSSVNIAEALPGLMTPLTWSFQKTVFEPWRTFPGMQSIGNIGGRAYMNLSVFISPFHALGMKPRKALDMLHSLLYTQLPESFEIPVIHFPKRKIPAVILAFLKLIQNQNRAVKKIPDFLKNHPLWCERMIEKIQLSSSGEELATLWENELLPAFIENSWTLMGATSGYTENRKIVLQKLRHWIDPEDAEVLLTNMVDDPSRIPLRDLPAGLGPAVGISRVIQGTADRKEYLEVFGHRGPDELELSVPRPAEDPQWLDRLIELGKENRGAAEALLLKRRASCSIIWNRFMVKYPSKVHSLRKKIDKNAKLGLTRELVRSEFARDRFVGRAFALRAGELIGIKNDIFFLTIDEVLEVLRGRQSALRFLPARRLTDERYRSYPPYPPIICGPFDPTAWASNPDRRTDLFLFNDPDGDTLHGSPGCAGKIEGIARCLQNASDGDKIQNGEILVTTMANISWTPFFSRTSAIVTDIGAPLSHAAVVARELGIPMVVGCNLATASIRTGDRILVDGGRGTVIILNRDG